VYGDNYPASQQNKIIAAIAQAIQMFLFVMVIAGETICQTLGIATPGFVRTLQESPWMYGFMIFMFGNNVQSALLQTGAFEVYVDGQLIFSKLETGRMPDMQLLKERFEEVGIEFK
jgi:selT/selW/selH-like putative selenoprotein